MGIIRGSTDLGGDGTCACRCARSIPMVRQAEHARTQTLHCRPQPKDRLTVFQCWLLGRERPCLFGAGMLGGGASLLSRQSGTMSVRRPVSAQRGHCRCLGQFIAGLELADVKYQLSADRRSQATAHPFHRTYEAVERSAATLRSVHIRRNEGLFEAAGPSACS